MRCPVMPFRGGAGANRRSLPVLSDAQRFKGLRRANRLDSRFVEP